ncbi:MAG TPA: glycogen/starch synthase, partial [Bryobacteraceae bacterium]|nr:glycogen/starch synthase [Bryobacteraceae bacterium]
MIKPARRSNINEMKILMVASEANPFAKTGGLADVIGALPVALAQRGEDVAVILPLYRQARPLLEQADRAFDCLPIQMGAASWNVDIRCLKSRGVTFYFVDRPDLFDRAELYTEAGEDYPDNHIRFAVLCHAALGVVRRVFRPDVLHCHDWQASLVGPLTRYHLGGDPTFYGIKTLLTVHNLGYQGIFPRETLTDLGLFE